MAIDQGVSAAPEKMIASEALATATEQACNNASDTKCLKHKTPLKEIFFKYLGITIGIVLASIALEIFLIPNSIIDGGVTGISIMVSYLSGLPLGFFTLLLNLPFIIIGAKQIGKRFAAAYLYAMIGLSIGVSLLRPVGEMTEDILLATIFGGVLLGIGVGMVIRYGACLDGTEMIAILIGKKTSLSVGQVVLFFNLFILGTAGLLFGWDRAMYSLIAYFIASKLIDMVTQGLDEAKAAFIISDYGEEIAHDIFQQLGRTVTFIEGRGLISGRKDILYAIMTRVEVSELREIVSGNDRSAFVTIMDVSDIFGSQVVKQRQH